LHHKQTLTNQIYLKEQVSNYLFTKYQQQQKKIVKVALIQRHKPGDVIGNRMESANNDARKWPILPFDVSRDFIIRNIKLVTSDHRTEHLG
jgi:radical SAM superfamily enzyme with C-terminal helix-hairpin-helix motif